MSQTSVEDRIRQRAYELYISRGQLPGREREDWFQAEREIMVGERHRPINGETGAPQPRPPEKAERGGRGAPHPPGGSAGGNGESPRRARR